MRAVMPGRGRPHEVPLASLKPSERSGMLTSVMLNQVVTSTPNRDLNISSSCGSGMTISLRRLWSRSSGRAGWASRKFGIVESRMENVA